MKILKCYIENFGKLSNQEFKFKDGLNTIIQDNGYGKTTLATFIKAMFYGLQSTTKRSLDENERKKYTPWQGGNYGGFLEFEVGNGLFRVERFFGKKESEDVFNIIDLKTGKKTNKFTNLLGEELFGLDAESYEKSTFIPQKEIASGINDKISTKLINMMQGTFNKDSFEGAMQLIKEKANDLKRRGNVGKIPEIEAEIAEINEEIDGIKRSAYPLESLQSNLNEEDIIIKRLIEEKQNVTKQIGDYGKKQEIAANKKYIEQKQQEKINILENIKNTERLLNGKDVSIEVINNISRKNDELLKLKSKESVFLENNSENARFSSLSEMFDGKKISNKEIQDIIEKEEKVRALKTELSLIQESKSKGASNKKTKVFSKSFLFVVLSLIFAAVGIITIKNIVYSIVAFSIAAILMGGGFTVKIKVKQKKSGLQLAKNLIEKQENLKKLTKEITEFVSQFETVENANILAFLYDLLSKNNEYVYLLEQTNKHKEEVLELKNNIHVLQKDIDSFINMFNIEKEGRSNLEIIEKIKLSQISLNENRVMLKNVENSLKEFGDIDFSALELNSDCDVDIEKLQEQEKEKQIQIDNHRDKKGEINRKIDSIKSMLNDLDDLEMKLEEKKEIKNELKKEYDILTLTNKFLTEANDNLTAKYKKPMQESLNKYLKTILDEEYHEFDLDTELNVSFEKFGQTRELDYLSKGYKGVVDLCIRFALVEALFEKEKPFIILDDPFVNFDGQKIKNAIELIKKVSEDYQLIYFVCHESRI